MARPRSDIAVRIVHAARERFLRDGVDGASLRHIAADAHTSIGMIYYYFATKDELFLAVVEEIYVLLLADLERALAADVPVKERLRRFYRRIGTMNAGELLTARLILREALVSSSRLDRLFRRFSKGHIPLIFGLVKEGVRSETMNAELHSTLLFIVTVALGAVPQVMRRVMPGRLPVSGLPEGKELSDALVDILLKGVGTESAQHRPSRSRQKTKRIVRSTS